MSTMSIQTPEHEPGISDNPEHTSERHLYVVPDVPQEQLPLHGPYTDAVELAEMPLDDISTIPEKNLDPTLRKQGKEAYGKSTGAYPVAFYYREAARKAADSRYGYS